MSSYTTTDFHESLYNSEIAGQLAADAIARVVAAWGVDDDGWTGGFVLALRDGRFAYLTGWCDYTGWGCQDGASLTFYDAEPDWREFDHGSAYAGTPWDEAPADLNRYLAGLTTKHDTPV